MIAKPIRISFVIVTRNRPACLSRCLSSIRYWEPPDVELVVIDDHSSGVDYAPILRQFNITLLRNESNIGPAASRNRGLSVAGGAFVFFLDDDAYLSAPSADVAADVLLRNPSVSAVAFPILEVSSSTVLYARRPGFAKTAAAGAAMYRKSDLLDVGGYDAKLRWSEEFDLAIRLHDRVGPVWNLPAPIVAHESAPLAGNIKNCRLAYTLEARLVTYWKHFSVRTAAIFSGRCLMSFVFTGIKGNHFAALICGIGFFLLQFPRVLRSRNPVSATTERYYCQKSSVEDEGSIPVYEKAFRILAAIRSRPNNSG